MSKITVTLTAVYDDGKSAKNPGDQISMDDKLARQLAALGMVELPIKEGRQPKGKKNGEDADSPNGSIGSPDLDALNQDAGDDEGNEGDGNG